MPLPRNTGITGTGNCDYDTLRHLETQITATDSQINQLVYALYDLSDDEITLVEASAKSS